MVDVKSELASSQIVLLVMSSGEYNEKIVDVVKGLSGNICYVTTNKTYDSLREVFEKGGVKMDGMVFIDAISKTMKKTPDQTENAYYVSSPGALTELSIAISKFLGHGFDYFVFDSLTNLAIYQKREMCSKFVASLIDKIKKTKTKAVFYAIESKNSEELIAHAGQMVDKVVSEGKAGG